MRRGYAGLPLASCEVEVGYDLVGLEVDRSRLEHLAAGDPYVEDIPSQQLAANLASGRYRPSLDHSEAADLDVAIITVPTPLWDGNPNPSYMEEIGRALAPPLRPGAAVLLESTTYPGRTEEVLAPILEASSGLLAGRDFSLGYSPERIDPGNPIRGLVNTPKVVREVNANSLAAAQFFLDGIVERTVPTKIAQGGGRQVARKRLSARQHRDRQQAGRLGSRVGHRRLGSDRCRLHQALWVHALHAWVRGRRPLSPDRPSYLSCQVKRTLGRGFRFVALANDVNDHMPDCVVQRVAELRNRERNAVNGSSVLLLRLAYKQGTSDARESPSMRVDQLLAARGADVRIADPLVNLDVLQLHEPLPARQVRLTAELVQEVDVVVLLVDHHESHLDSLRGATVFDTLRLRHDESWTTL